MRKRILMALGAMAMLAGAEAQEWCNIWKDGKVVKSVAVAEIDSITVKRAKVDGAIDLGLESGTAWAASNVGATDPGESGTFFAWGETEAKESYTEANSKWYGIEKEELIAQGVLDANGNLTAKYDAATANMGDGWRMPTSKELDELIALENVDTVYNGVGGRMFIGKNGNTMFIAYSGFVDGTENKNLGVAADLWAAGAGGSKYGNNLYAFDGDADWSGSPRYYGSPVRAVRDFATSDYVRLHKGGKVSAEIEADSVTFGKKFVDYIKLLEGKWLGVKEVEADGTVERLGDMIGVTDGKSSHGDMRMSGDSVWLCMHCGPVVIREITDETLVYDAVDGVGELIATLYYENAKKTEEYLKAIEGEWKPVKAVDADGENVDVSGWDNTKIENGEVWGDVCRVSGDTIYLYDDGQMLVVKEKSEKTLVMEQFDEAGEFLGTIWFAKWEKYVDLGLKSGTLWARMNVGAGYIWEWGDYFAWGETNAKEEYLEENYMLRDMTSDELKAAGVIDENGNLTAEYDAATANWGSEWRMPTKEEIEELLELENEETEVDDWKGRMFYGKNGETLFLPYGGYMNGDKAMHDNNEGEYWSATAGEKDWFADYLLLDSDGADLRRDARYWGFTVRPVRK